MAAAKMTLIGMYNWDNTLFAGLSTPSGIDNSLLIDTILLNGGEFETLYADFDFMKNAIGRWSSKWQRTMERWISVLGKEYNPIENYDRIEDWTDSNNKASTMTSNRNEDSTHSEGTTRNETAVASDASVSSGDGNTTNKRSAYDSTDYSPHDKSDTTSKGVNNSLGTTDAKGETNTSGIDSLRGSNEDKSTEIGNGIHSGRIHGNIGVKTTQSMVLEEIDVSRFNIYDEIANLFLQELTIYTY